MDIQFREELTTEEEKSLIDMRQEIFGSMVDEAEGKEDFINEPYAFIILKDGEKAVGNVDLHRSEGACAGKKILIGGLSIGILEEYRKHGYGGKLMSEAMNHLKSKNYDIGFLAAAPGTTGLYEKYGWQVLKVPYTWENVYEEIKSDTDGMIIPLNDQNVVEGIQTGKEPLHVGRGYW